MEGRGLGYFTREVRAGPMVDAVPGRTLRPSPPPFKFGFPGSFLPHNTPRLRRRALCIFFGCLQVPLRPSSVSTSCLRPRRRWNSTYAASPSPVFACRASARCRCRRSPDGPASTLAPLPRSAHILMARPQKLRQFRYRIRQKSQLGLARESVTLVDAV